MNLCLNHSLSSNSLVFLCVHEEASFIPLIQFSGIRCIFLDSCWCSLCMPSESVLCVVQQTGYTWFWQQGQVVGRMGWISEEQICAWALLLIGVLD